MELQHLKRRRICPRLRKSAAPFGLNALKSLAFWHGDRLARSFCLTQRLAESPHRHLPLPNRPQAWAPFGRPHPSGCSLGCGFCLFSRALRSLLKVFLGEPSVSPRANLKLRPTTRPPKNFSTMFSSSCVWNQREKVEADFSGSLTGGGS